MCNEKLINLSKYCALFFSAALRRRLWVRSKEKCRSAWLVHLPGYLIQHAVLCKVLVLIDRASLAKSKKKKNQEKKNHKVPAQQPTAVCIMIRLECWLKTRINRKEIGIPTTVGRPRLFPSRPTATPT